MSPPAPLDAPLAGTRLFLWGVLAALLCSSSCGRPVPADKQAYVGLWTGPHRSLEIRADGAVSYRHQEGASHTEINAELRRFDVDDFAVGVGCVATTFRVTAPPHQEDGQWKMTVDGEELTRFGGVPKGFLER